MKRIITLAICMIGLSVITSAQFKFGGGVQFFDGEFGLQAKANNAFTEDFTGQGTFSYYFVSGATFWGIDADVHYFGFDLGDLESFALAPFAGLNILTASAGGFSNTNLNLNIGINGTLPLDSGLEVYIEPKIVIGNGSGFAISGGVYF